MKKNTPPLSAGNLLLAQPLLGDPNFDRTVILLADYNSNGALGFVLNKPLDLQLDTLTVDFPSFEARIYDGGPVQRDNLFFVHRKGNLLPGSAPICPGVYWGGQLEALKEMLSAGLIGSDEIRFYLGYSGWSAGQLEEEMLSQSWLVLPAGADKIFETPSEELWPGLLREQGEEYALWQNSPFDPRLN